MAVATAQFLHLGALVAWITVLPSMEAPGSATPGSGVAATPARTLLRPANLPAENKGAAHAGVAGGRLSLQGLSGPFADRTRLILRQPVVKRIKPAEVFATDPIMLEWLLAHPVWATELWRAMGVPISPLTKIAGGYECREDQAMARIHIVHAEPGLRVIYCLGEARKPPLPGKLRAEMVVVQRYGFSKQTDGQYHAVQQLEAYAYAEGAALKAIMRLTRAACEQLVDRCLQDMTVYFALLTRVMQLQPQWALENIRKAQVALPEAEAIELTAIVARNPGRTMPHRSELAERLLQPAAKPGPTEPLGESTRSGATPSPFVSSWTIETPKPSPDSPVLSTERRPPSTGAIRR